MRVGEQGDDDSRSSSSHVVDLSMEQTGSMISSRNLDQEDDAARAAAGDEARNEELEAAWRLIHASPIDNAAVSSKQPKPQSVMARVLRKGSTRTTEQPFLQHVTELGHLSEAVRDMRIQVDNDRIMREEREKLARIMHEEREKQAAARLESIERMLSNTIGNFTTPRAISAMIRGQKVSSDRAQQTASTETERRARTNSRALKAALQLLKEQNAQMKEELVATAAAAAEQTPTSTHMPLIDQASAYVIRCTQSSTMGNYYTMVNYY